MPGVQRFVDQRQQAQSDSQRHLLAHLHKVPVPATKLQRTDRIPLDRKPSKNLLANVSTKMHLRYQSGPQLTQTANDHGNGFETDAEGLEDTTVMSAGYDSGSQQGNEDDGNQTSLSFGLMREHEQDDQNLEQLEARDLTMDGDDESYEESGQESDDKDRDDDSVEESCVHGVLQGFKSPGFTRFRQQAMATKEGSFQQIIESSSMRNSDYANLPMRYVRDESPNTTNASPPCNHSAGNDRKGSDAVTQSQDQGRNSSTRMHDLPIKIQRNNGYMMQLSKSIPPSPQQRTVMVDAPSTMQRSTALFRPLSAEALVSTKRVEGNTDGDAYGEDMMQPRTYFNQVANVANLHGHSETGMRSNLSHETKSILNDPAGLGNDKFSSGEQQGTDKTSKVRSAASQEHGHTRTRGRSIDYSLDQLSGMDFKQLSAEAFQLDPQSKTEILPLNFASSTLVKKLDYLAKLKTCDARAPQQRAFLASLPMAEYEECGDIMVERFSDFVKMFKNARQQRRKITQDFEMEVAKREGRIRGEIHAFEKDLGRLKRGGEKVVTENLAL